MAAGSPVRDLTLLRIAFRPSSPRLLCRTRCRLEITATVEIFNNYSAKTPDGSLISGSISWPLKGVIPNGGGVRSVNGIVRRIGTTAKTLTWGARESSGRLKERPARMRASAVTDGVWGGRCRGNRGPSAPRAGNCAQLWHNCGTIDSVRRR